MLAHVTTSTVLPQTDESCAGVGIQVTLTTDTAADNHKCMLSLALDMWLLRHARPSHADPADAFCRSAGTARATSSPATSSPTRRGSSRCTPSFSRVGVLCSAAPAGACAACHRVLHPPRTQRRCREQHWCTEVYSPHDVPGKTHNCLVAHCVFMNAGSGVLCQPGATNCQVQ
jgi:hypothetical protein